MEDADEDPAEPAGHAEPGSQASGQAASRRVRPSAAQRGSVARLRAPSAEASDTDMPDAQGEHNMATCLARHGSNVKLHDVSEDQALSKWHVHAHCDAV